jgi:Flp pilus assembly protein protease CpaA
MNAPFFPDPVFAWTFYGVLLAITAVAAYIDLRKLVIPKPLTLVTLVLGVVFSVVRVAWLGTNGQTEGVWSFPFVPIQGTWTGALAGLWFAVVGFFFAFALFFVMWVLGTCGGGDVKLFAALGTWGGVVLTLLLLLGTVIFVVLLALARLAWGLVGGGVRTTVRDYSVKGAARKGKYAGTQGGSDAPRPRKRLTAYSLSVCLSVAFVVLMWVLTHTAPRPEQSRMETPDNAQTLLGREE